MRFLIVFLLIFGINLGAKNIEEGLKFLEIPNAKKEVLREAMIEFYKQRQNYHKNNEIVEYGILSEIAKNGYGSVNFVEYQRRLENIYQDYIHAKITFYRSIGQILDEQEIVNLMEFIGED